MCQKRKKMNSLEERREEKSSWALKLSRESVSKRSSESNQDRTVLKFIDKPVSKVVFELRAMDSCNAEKYPTAPPAYNDNESALKKSLNCMEKIQEHHTSNIESLQIQMKTTREAITKINMQIDAQEDEIIIQKVMSEIQKKQCAKISKQIDAPEDNSKAISGIQKKLKTNGWKRFLRHLMIFILANGIIDYVAYFYFCPWFGIKSSVNYGIIKDMANLCIVVYLLLKY